jgi:phenylacetic acid degradation operon negative regulatory protein
MQSRHLPTIKPLTARSIVLSTLLGYHPPALPASALVRVGGLFGIAERTVRVALGRMVADGDLSAENGAYRLTERLVARQVRQDESCSPRTRRWRGLWEMAIVTAPPRPLAERVALRKIMVERRLEELREGVWVRPANLVRGRHRTVVEQCTFFEARPEGDPGDLARSLWDLPAWAAEARRLRQALDQADGLVESFMVSAEVLRHLLLDPVLPPELLPEDWPGGDLRARYVAFSSTFAATLREYGEG